MTHWSLPLRRIRGMLRRHGYLLLGSWPRLLDLVYWPTVQMILWGFITRFLVGQSGWVAKAAGVFLSAVLLWDTLFRGQLGVSLCFLEEMYARHLGHLFVSPLRPYEHVVAVFLIALMRVLIGVGGAAMLAIPISMASGSAARSAGRLVPFFAVLMLFGWAIGLIIAGTGHPPWHGCRKPGLGGDLLHPAVLRCLLPDRNPPSMGAGDRLVPADRSDLRGDARRGNPWSVRCRPVHARPGPPRRLAGDCSQCLYAPVPFGPAAGFAAAVRRVSGAGPNAHAITWAAGPTSGIGLMTLVSILGAFAPFSIRRFAKGADGSGPGLARW